MATLQDKIKYCENQIQIPCPHHNKQSKLFCAEINCTQSPYLCDKCTKSNSHPHPESIFPFQPFLKRLIQTIDESPSPSPVMQLRRRLNSIIDQHMQSYKPPPKFNLYTDPYILVNKINTEPSFLPYLKKHCCSPPTPQDLTPLLAQLRQCLNDTNKNTLFQHIPHNKTTLAPLNHRIPIKDQPLAIKTNAADLLLSYTRQTILLNIKSKGERKWDITIKKPTLTQNALACLNAYDSKQLFYIAFNKIDKVNKYTHKQQIKSIGLYQSTIFVHSQSCISIINTTQSTIQPCIPYKIDAIHCNDDYLYAISSNSSNSSIEYTLTEYHISTTVTPQQSYHLPLFLPFCLSHLSPPFLIIVISCRNIVVYNCLLHLVVCATHYKEECIIDDVSAVWGNNMLKIYLKAKLCVYVYTVQLSSPDHVTVQQILMDDHVTTLYEDRIYSVKKKEDGWGVGGYQFVS